MIIIGLTPVTHDHFYFLNTPKELQVERGINFFQNEIFGIEGKVVGVRC